MRYVSICSGIEAVTLAAKPLGWQADWFAEMEAFPSAVLQHHYPDIENKGDITEINIGNETTDLVIGGTPCQSYSIAGNKQGLDDPRGQLVREHIRLAAEMDARWIVWENVPNSLSVNGGRDFRTILRWMDDFGYQCAWRVLDAQYFGVPQRRRRIFLVGYIGDWRPPAAVLFESDCLQRRVKTRKEKRQGVALQSGKNIRVYSGGREEKDIASTLTSSNQRLDFDTENLVVGTLCHGGQSAGAINNQDVYAGLVIAFKHNAGAKAGSLSVCEDISPTLLTGYSSGVPAILPLQDKAVRKNDEIQNGSGIGNEGDPSFTLTTCDRHGVLLEDAPRRLTPLECERLQGLPDYYTRIPWRNKPAELCPDAPRYKAVGNSMAVPNMRWLLSRIDEVDKLLKLKVA